MANSIEIDQLLRTVQSILTGMIDSGTTRLELGDANFYWAVADDHKYDVSIEPPKVDIGSLRDDIDFILPLLSDESQAFPLMLVHIAPLLEFIALQSVQSGDAGQSN